MTRAVMIVNPASANGRTARQWPEIARKAVEHGLDVDVVTTEARDHATSWHGRRPTLARSWWSRSAATARSRRL